MTTRRPARSRRCAGRSPPRRSTFRRAEDGTPTPPTGRAAPDRRTRTTNPETGLIPLAQKAAAEVAQGFQDQARTSTPRPPPRRPRSTTSTATPEDGPARSDRAARADAEQKLKEQRRNTGRTGPRTSAGRRQIAKVIEQLRRPDRGDQEGRRHVRHPARRVGGTPEPGQGDQQSGAGGGASGRRARAVPHHLPVRCAVQRPVSWRGCVAGRPAAPSRRRPGAARARTTGAGTAVRRLPARHGRRADPRERGSGRRQRHPDPDGRRPLQLLRPQRSLPGPGRASTSTPASTSACSAAPGSTRACRRTCTTRCVGASTATRSARPSTRSRTCAAATPPLPGSSRGSRGGRIFEFDLFGQHFVVQLPGEPEGHGPDPRPSSSSGRRSAGATSAGPPPPSRSPKARTATSRNGDPAALGGRSSSTPAASSRTMRATCTRASRRPATTPGSTRSRPPAGP
jgi:hypothetical protein